MLKIEHLTKTYGGKPAVQGRLPAHPPGGAVRLYRPQRRGQDHYLKMLLRYPAI